MSNLETAQRTAGLLESRDLKGLQELLADDFRAKGQTLELTKHKDTYFGEEVVQGGGLTGILSQLGVKLP